MFTFSSNLNLRWGPSMLSQWKTRRVFTKVFTPEGRFCSKVQSICKITIKSAKSLSSADNLNKLFTVYSYLALFFEILQTHPSDKKVPNMGFFRVSPWDIHHYQGNFPWDFIVMYLDFKSGSGVITLITHLLYTIFQWKCICAMIHLRGKNQ